MTTQTPNDSIDPDVAKNNKKFNKLSTHFNIHDDKKKKIVDVAT